MPRRLSTGASSDRSDRSWGPTCPPEAGRLLRRGRSVGVRGDRAYPPPVTALPASTRQGPLLRIEQLAIRNFRTFRERTVIPFRGGAPAADSIATFHGD